MPVIYLECVLKVGDFGHISSWPRILASATNKCMRSSMKIGQPRLLCKVLRDAIKGCRHTQNHNSLKQKLYVVIKRTGLVNKGQNMLHKLCLDAKSIRGHILLASIQIGVYKYVFIWWANFASIVHPMKLRCSFTSKPMAWYWILNCGCK